MMTILLTILFDFLIALIVMTGIWAFFNRESQKVVEIQNLVGEISQDLSTLTKDLKILGELLSEIAQPLLNPQVVDVESKPLGDETDC